MIMGYSYSIQRIIRDVFRGFNKLFDNMIAMDLVQGRCPNFFSGDGKDEAAPSFLFALMTIHNWEDGWNSSNSSIDLYPVMNKISEEKQSVWGDLSSYES